ncbi:hypothetical protein IQE94_08330 [Synechocystis sp. PCC 7339]|uniref:DUF6439 family protein n=1 Tax=Synechocystis sp. PCC 7339 TaxID=2782213 RepID=UPI001CBCCBBC|nr:DUF6439 family protein [Synechocystis sp. PCC 7339]UAJ74232.1 hypothetical protein IQE94_08330 [Synechocystis sp. PCC 7339]
MIPFASQTSSLVSHPELSALELAQALAERLAIAPQDWHRLKGNRQAQAGQELAAALVYLLRDNPQEALTHVQQAEGWLDRSLSAPSCPTHGDRSKKA